MKIKVVVTLKNGVLDPQGKAIQQTLNGMGYSNIEGVRQGKYFDLEVAEKWYTEKLSGTITFKDKKYINPSIHPHQIHIELLSELGILGYLCFVVFFIYSFSFSI